MFRKGRQSVLILENCDSWLSVSDLLLVLPFAVGTWISDQLTFSNGKEMDSCYKKYSFKNCSKISYAICSNVWCCRMLLGKWREKSWNMLSPESGQPACCKCWWLGCYNIWACCACCIQPTQWNTVLLLPDCWMSSVLVNAVFTSLCRRILLCAADESHAPFHIPSLHTHGSYLFSTCFHIRYCT